MILIREDQNGHIDLAGHPTLRSFPVRKVRGHLALWRCKLLRLLPSTFEVGGNLGLDWCPSLTRLPPTLRVGGFLSIQNTPLTELPNDLEIGWSLYLEGSKVTHVPKGAKIDGRVCGLGVR